MLKIMPSVLFGSGLNRFAVVGETAVYINYSDASVRSQDFPGEAAPSSAQS